jgi:poly(A) polymerase
VQARWRLANSEMQAAADLLAAAQLLIGGHFHEAAYRHGAVAGDAVALAAALDDWTADAVREARLRLVGLSVPAFPVTAGDLLQLGMRPGPHLGAELKRLERRWIESGFALDRGTLLDDVRH